MFISNFLEIFAQILAKNMKKFENIRKIANLLSKLSKICKFIIDF